MTRLAAVVDAPRPVRGFLLDAGALLLVVLCIPLAVLSVGAPFAPAARLLLELFTRL